MEIDNPQSFDHILCADGSVLRFKMVDIGPFDMFSNASVDVPLGLTYGKIVAAFVTIWNDLDTKRTFLWSVLATAAYRDGAMSLLPGPPVILRIERRTGGQYNVVDYIDAVMNRGTILVAYLE